MARVGSGNARRSGAVRNYAGRGAQRVAPLFVLGFVIAATANCNELLDNERPGGLGGLGTGASGSGGNGSGAAQSGGSGSAGEAGASNSGGQGSGGTLPTLDDECASSGLLACDEGNPRQKLLCSQGVWQGNGSCDSGEACDPATGTCADILLECEGREEGDRHCGAGDQLLACGENLVSASVVEACEGRCVSSDSSAACVPATCGDGKPQTSEACDDGDDDNDDDCTKYCKTPACGDGFEQTGESCDDGDGDNDDDCTQICEAPFCGDGFVQPIEACDPQDPEDGHLCSTTCTWRVTQVATSRSGSHACALRADGQLKCWGGNVYGRLGLGDAMTRGDDSAEMGQALPIVDLGSGQTAAMVTVGAGHTCALLDDASVKCWGYNAYGQLGLGNITDRGDNGGEMGDALPVVDLGDNRTAVSIAAAIDRVCALLDNASVKCWGYNGSGQLGIGDVSSRGNGSGAMGNALPAVDLGTNRSAVSIAAGAGHTCALLDDASVKCWGINGTGGLGIGDAATRGDSTGEMGDALPSVDLGSGRTAISVTAGSGHTCALLDDASVKCWGSNDAGQLGLGDTEARGDNPGEMGDALPTVNLGSNRTALNITAGDGHTCALLDDASVKCWGSNTYGSLGLGDDTTRGDNSEEMGNALPAIDLGSNRSAVSITAGNGRTCAILDDASVKCWGSNSYGSLGLGDLSDRGAAPDEMGDALPTVSLW